MSNNKTLFIICPIKSEGSPERKRSDLVKERLIKPAAEDHGFRCFRADDMHEPGKIDEQVIREVINSDLVVADLTDHNPNVFYELAVRHATQKPVILLMKQGQNVPFDITTQRTIFYDDQNVETFLKAKDDLEKQIQTILANEFVPDSPIRQALLNENSSPMGDQYQEILQILRNTTDEIGIIRDQMMDIQYEVSEINRDKQQNIEQVLKSYYERQTRTRRKQDDIIDSIITIILENKPNLSRETIEKLIDEERVKAAGLLTREAAAHLVASNLGILL